MKLKRVVVTGLGAVSPIGNNVNDFKENLFAGKSGAAPFTRFDTSNHKTRFGCEVKGFDPLQSMEKAEARKMDLFSQFGIASAFECLKDAGINLDLCNRNRVGVIWATGVGGIQTTEDELISFASNVNNPRFSPFFITKMIPNMCAGLISIRFGLKGVSYATASACSSSNNSIGDAFNFIRLGKADAIIAGGSDACLTRAAIGGFGAMRALSERNDSPETASRPFDIARDGFVMGEGGGALLLEDLDHALARGAKIYCEIGGCGFASDAHHITAPHPEGEGAAYAIREALHEAELSPCDVDHINAHATSTPLGDISECKAIEHVFADCLDKVYITGTKSMTGHLLGAAGAIESIATVLSIQNNIIPPTINVTQVDPVFNPNLKLVLNESISHTVNVALNHSFGFGGHIVVSLFKKYNI
jgi:3-oxoacyl-[acyl-carrier-protein] synthase II